MTIESNTEVSQCLDTSILVLLKKWSTWATGWSNIVVTKAFWGISESISFVGMVTNVQLYIQNTD